jgi:hypothetical protein
VRYLNGAADAAFAAAINRPHHASAAVPRPTPFVCGPDAANVPITPECWEGAFRANFVPPATPAPQTRIVRRDGWTEYAPTFIGVQSDLVHCCFTKCNSSDQEKGWSR